MKCLCLQGLDVEEQKLGLKILRICQQSSKFVLTGHVLNGNNGPGLVMSIFIIKMSLKLLKVSVEKTVILKNHLTSSRRRVLI
jgi:hypothetical protein